METIGPAIRDLNDLHYFAQVVRHGGFTAAAKATGAAKGKLSKCVARLERDLGVRLIERSTRSVRVTDVGREIYRQCVIIENGLEAAEAIVARSQNEIRGIVRVGCPPGLAQYMGPQVFVDFMARYPLVRVQLHLANRRVALIAENIDVALRAAIDTDDDQSLTVRSLALNRRVLLAAPALLAQGAPEIVDDLARLPTLSIGEHIEHDHWELINVAGEKRSFAHHPRLSGSDLMILRAAAAAGLGVCLLPEESCAVELAGGALVRILPDWHGADPNIQLAFTTPKGLHPAVRAFIDHVVQAFSELQRLRALPRDHDQAGAG
jgi:DNA-binding transcriptional LysR family regulator